MQIIVERSNENIGDSIIKICAKKYISTINSIELINTANNKATQNFLFLILWENGATILSTAAVRNTLLVAILNTNDSTLFAALGSCNLTKEIAPRQTECCAIQGYTDYDSDKAKILDPLILAALSINGTFQNFSYSNLNKGKQGAIIRMIDVGLVEKNLSYATKNGYSKWSGYADSLYQLQHNKTAIPTIPAKTKKQPIWLWLLGGFVVAAILYFVIGKRATTTT